MDLHQYDALNIFSEFILELEKHENDEKRAERRLNERRNREAFR